MELKLKNNSKLECSLPDDIKLKITSIFHQNTPNVNALSLINDVVAYQKTHQEELILLNRIRADIGNVEGSLSDLMELVGMAGFNDNYGPQAKPRLVGTYTINDWYTSEQLAEAQATFDGLTIVPDANYLVNFENIYLQSLDDEKDGYNLPIINYFKSIGMTYSLAEPIKDGLGVDFMTKELIESITSIPSFNGNTSIKTFEEFKYFTGVTSLPVDFIRSVRMTKISISPSVRYVGKLFCYGTSNIFIEFIGTVSSINSEYFMALSNNSKIHFWQETPPSFSYTKIHPPYESGGSGCRIYVGDGSSSEHDENIKNAYNAAISFTQITSRLDTWYNYLHPSA